MAERFIELHNNPKIFVVTYKNTVLYYTNAEPIGTPDVSIMECQSEEADQRLVRHTMHCVSDCQIYDRVVVRTVDTDVLILMISYLQLMNSRNRVQIFTEIVNTPTFYNTRDIIEVLGPKTCQALPFFYVFTGYDIVSSFYQKRKCKSYDIWMNSY